MHGMNWDDLNVVLSLARTGALARAAKELDVDHTTVGRRVAAIEASLGVRLFVRSPRGYLLTAEAERLIPGIEQVEQAVHGVERSAQGHQSELTGVVRITSGESFGVGYLAPRLADFGQLHPGLGHARLREHHDAGVGGGGETGRRHRGAAPISR